MRLKTQIILGFLFILILTLVLSGIFVYYLNGIGQNYETILKGNYRSVKATKELLVSASKIDQLLGKISLGNNYSAPILKEILITEQGIFEKNLTVCKEAIHGLGEEQIVNNLENEFRRYLADISRLDSVEDKRGYYFTVLQRQNENLRLVITNLIDLNYTELSKKNAEAHQLYYNARIYVFIFTIAIMAIGFIAIYNIPNRILKPIHELTLKIKNMALGQYDHEFNENAPGEIGDLSRAVKILNERLSDYEASNLAEITAQKRRIESLIKNLNDGLLLLNEKKEIILINTAACEILDIPEEKLIGQNAVDLSVRSNVIRELLQTIKQSEEDPEFLAEEELKNFIKVNHEDGAQEFYTKEILTVYNHNENSESTSLGYIITLKNITTYKKSDEAKTSFIATVSHELKTPLSALNMSVMLLQDQRFGSLNPDQQKIAGSMKSEVQRLIRIVTELLDLSKVETGNIELEKKVVNAHDLIAYSTSPIQSQLDGKNITLEKIIDPAVKDLMVDAEKISWVLINLLNNAMRYTEEGGTISLSVRKKQDAVEFSVQDSGPGIGKDDLHKIFKKFVQIRKNGQKNSGSLGIGLAISKEVIETHEGQIGVESEIGKGARFFFTIPA